MHTATRKAMMTNWEVIGIHTLTANDVPGYRTSSTVNKEVITVTTTERLQVPGGWLVRSTVVVDADLRGGSSIAQTFITDANHEWEIDIGAERPAN